MPGQGWLEHGCKPVDCVYANFSEFLKDPSVELQLDPECLVNQGCRATRQARIAFREQTAEIVEYYEQQEHSSAEQNERA